MAKAFRGSRERMGMDFSAYCAQMKNGKGMGVFFFPPNDITT